MNENAIQIEEHDNTFNVKKVSPFLDDGTGSLTRQVSPIRKDLEGAGKTAVGTTAVEITFTGTTTSIIISADKDNSGTLYVGKSDVTSLGANAITFLEPGESVEMDYDDTSNAIYVVGSEASQNYWAGALL